MKTCSKEIADGYSWYKCKKPVAGTEDGKPWCKIHLPSAVRARRDAQDAKWAAESAVRGEQYRRDKAMIWACRDIPTEALEAPEANAHIKAALGVTL